MWSTTNMQKFRARDKKKNTHAHKRIKVCAKHGSSLFSQWVTLRRKLSRPCNWCPAVFFFFWGGDWLVGWCWFGKGRGGMGLGLRGGCLPKNAVVEDRQCDWAWGTVRVHEHQRQRQSPTGAQGGHCWSYRSSSFLLRQKHFWMTRITRKEEKRNTEKKQKQKQNVHWLVIASLLHN